MKDKLTAGILALLLGGIGVHRFYLGQTGLGILYLVFCLTTIPFWAGIVDGVIFLTQTQEAFDAKYNQGKSSARPGSTVSTSVADELLKLNELKEKGIISISEFEARKAKLLQ